MAVAALVVSLCALVVSALIALEQRRLETAQPVAYDVFRELRESAMKRRNVVQGLRDVSPQDGLDGISDPQLRRIAIEVSHNMDNLGMLVAHKLAKIDIVAGGAGDTVIRMWQVLGPFIEREREIRSERGDATDPIGYQAYFEYLATIRLANATPEKVRRHYMPELYGE